MGGGDYRAAFVCGIVFLAGNMSSFPVAIVRDYDPNKRLLSRNVVNVPKFIQCSLFWGCFFFHDSVMASHQLQLCFYS